MKTKLRSRRFRVLVMGLLALGLLLLAFITVAIVTTAREQGDMSLRTLRPCGPPCWQGIVPGYSSSKDVERILDLLAFVDPKTVRSQSIPGSSGTYFTWQTNGFPSRFGAIWVENNKVTKIRTTPGFELTLGAAVERLGPPTFVHPNNVADADAHYYVLAAYYPESGLALYSAQLPYALGSDKSYTVEPEFRIEEAWYFAPTTLETVVSVLESPFSSDTVQAILKHTYTWRGYGIFSVESIDGSP